MIMSSCVVLVRVQIPPRPWIFWLSNQYKRWEPPMVPCAHRIMLLSAQVFHNVKRVCAICYLIV